GPGGGRTRRRGKGELRAARDPGRGGGQGGVRLRVGGGGHRDRPQAQGGLVAGGGGRRRLRHGPLRIVRAYIGLGSNLGDRLAYLQRAADLLGRTEGVRILRSSRVYESEPVGGPPQPDYLNAVVEVETDLSAPDLLRACLSVE